VRWLCRIYFGALLAFARRIGLRLVWTAHNLLPHRPVFDDDGAARRTLLAAIDAVVVHHPKTAVDLADRFGKLPPVVVAPQGGAELPLLPARDAARRELTLPTDRLALVFTGRILPYKGLLELFAALAQLSPNERSRIALRIAGEPEPVSHRDELTAAASPLRDLDLAIEWERISDARYATYLAAADLALFPFRSITNSGSVITALSAGTPVLIAGHPTLAALPEPAALRYTPNDGLDALIGALRVALARTPTEWAEARAAAASFATTATWATAAEVHRELYRKLLGGGQ
jgi:glycosyltransferase involved in cell wall biosynthesis